MAVEPMRPEDVPADMVAAFKRAELLAVLDEGVDPVRAVLARFLPEDERRVRAEACTEIMARAASYNDTVTGPRASFRRGLVAAARHVAPSPTPQEVVEAIANGYAAVCDLSEPDERGGA